MYKLLKLIRMKKILIFMLLFTPLIGVNAQVFQLSPHLTYGQMYTTTSINNISLNNGPALNGMTDVDIRSKSQEYSVDFSYNIKRRTFTLGLGYVNQTDSMYTGYSTDWTSGEWNAIGTAKYHGVVVSALYDKRAALSNKASNNTFISIYGGLVNYFYISEPYELLTQAKEGETSGSSFDDVSNSSFEEFLNTQYSGVYSNLAVGVSLSLKNIQFSAQGMYLLNGNYSSDKIGWALSAKYNLLFYKKFKLNIYED